MMHSVGPHWDGNETWLVLGGLLQQIHVENGQFAGGSFDYLTPFSLMCGLALVAGYALLGATWLIMKTEGELEKRARTFAMPLLIAMLAFIALVSIWTPIHFDRIALRWFSLPNLYWLLPLPAATIVAAYLCWQGFHAIKLSSRLPAQSCSSCSLMQDWLCRISLIWCRLLSRYGMQRRIHRAGYSC
ncbi:MAG: cytochrome d ubiquinol oxidase subunit II [Burkholderiaceae bacterium]